MYSEKQMVSLLARALGLIANKGGYMYEGKISPPETTRDDHSSAFFARAHNTHTHTHTVSTLITEAEG